MVLLLGSSQIEISKVKKCLDLGKFIGENLKWIIKKS